MEFAREMLHALMILVMIPGTKSKERKKDTQREMQRD